MSYDADRRRTRRTAAIAAHGLSMLRDMANLSAREAYVTRAVVGAVAAMLAEVEENLARKIGPRS